MAIYVYKIVTGVLNSWIPDDLTIAQAQVQGLLATNAQMASIGCTAVDGLPPLDATHAWDVPTKTVVTMVAPRSMPAQLDFWRRFTSTERQALEGLYLTGTQVQRNRAGAFYRYVASAPSVDCNDVYIQGEVTALESIPPASPILVPGRAAQILV